MAPEVFFDSHSHSADMWSLGILTYVLIFGSFPFNGEGEQEVYEQIMTKRPKFKKEEKRRTSIELRRFIRRLVKKTANKRLTATSAFQDPWISDNK
jgi:calcium-dependent protein kinase